MKKVKKAKFKKEKPPKMQKTSKFGHARSAKVPSTGYEKTRKEVFNLK